MFSKEICKADYCQEWWKDYKQVSAFPVYKIELDETFYGYFYCRYVKKCVPKYVYSPDEDLEGITASDHIVIADELNKLNEWMGLTDE